MEAVGEKHHHNDRSRKNSLFRTLFSHETTKNAHKNVSADTVREDLENIIGKKLSKEDEFSKRNSSISNCDSAALLDAQRRYSRRSQSVCVSSATASATSSATATPTKVGYNNNRQRNFSLAANSTDLDDIEKQIMKAKCEAKTVSVIDGNLYIDYQFVASIPSGSGKV